MNEYPRRFDPKVFFERATTGVEEERGGIQGTSC